MDRSTSKSHCPSWASTRPTGQPSVPLPLPLLPLPLLLLLPLPLLLAQLLLEPSVATQSPDRLEYR